MTGLVRCVAAAITAALVLGACEQGEGDRCQTDSDCKAGLVCSQSLQVCQDVTDNMDSGVIMPDAATGEAPDASEVDASTVDAVPAIDATDDAAVDAT